MAALGCGRKTRTMFRVQALIALVWREKQQAQQATAVDLRRTSFRHGAAEDPTDPEGRHAVDPAVADRAVVDVVGAVAVALPLMVLLGAAVAFANG